MNRETKQVARFEKEIGVAIAEEKQVELRGKIYNKRATPTEYETLVKSYLRFVLKLANQFHNKYRRIPLADFIGAGNEALLRAIAADNPNQFNSGQFIGFITKYVTSEFHRLILRSEHYSMRISASFEARFKTAERVRDECAQHVGHAPTISELEAYVQLLMDQEHVKAKLAYYNASVALRKKSSKSGIRVTREEILKELIRRDPAHKPMIESDPYNYSNPSHEDRALAVFAKNIDSLLFYLDRSSIVKLSLNDPYGESSRITLGDTVVGEIPDPLRESLLEDSVQKILSSLPKKLTRNIKIFLRYYEGKDVTFDSLMEEFGINTRERVRQIVQRLRREVRRRLWSVGDITTMLERFKKAESINDEEIRVYLAYHTSKLPLPTFKQVAKSLNIKETKSVEAIIIKVWKLIDQEFKEDT